MYCLFPESCHIPRSVQGQVSWGLEQLSLVEDVPAHGQEAEGDGLQAPFQPKPLHESVK